MKTDKYYLFPTNILAKSNDPTKLFNFIAGYTLWNQSEKYTNKANPLAKERILEVCDYSTLDSIKRHFPTDQVMFKNFVFMGLDIGMNEDEIVEAADSYLELAPILEQDKEVFTGKEPTVSIRWDLLYDYKLGRIHPNQFRVYCAILSIIGKRKSGYARITYDHIRHRAAGFRSSSYYKRYAFFYQRESSLMSDRQIGYAVGRLERMSLLTTLLYCKRVKYYSVKLDPFALYEAILGAKNRKIKYFDDKKLCEQKLRELKKTG